jgi:hypothetical protein
MAISRRKGGNAITEPEKEALKREGPDRAGARPCRRNAGSLLAGRQLLGYYDQVHHLYTADYRQSRFDSNFFSNQRAMEIIDA